MELTPVILAKTGVKAQMRFSCCDCGETITGAEVHEGVIVYLVKRNPQDPLKSVWRCECCQADQEESERD